MKNTENQNWENRWQETLAGYESKPTTEDWSGMQHLLKTQNAEPAEAFADPDVPRFPGSSVRWFFKFWPQSLLGLFLVGGLGFGLGQCQAEEITNEIKNEIDFFSKEADPPPNYNLRPVIDSTPGGYHKRQHPVTIRSAKTVYRYDTIYHIDKFGNLTDSIYRIDSAKVVGLH